MKKYLAYQIYYVSKSNVTFLTISNFQGRDERNYDQINNAYDEIA